MVNSLKLLVYNRILTLTTSNVYPVTSQTNGISLKKIYDLEYDFWISFHF